MTVLDGGIIRVSAQDLVGTVVEKNGLTTICEHIPMGHKVALRAIRKGEQIIKFGVPIGRATNDIPEGAWVHSKNMELCPAPELDSLPVVATSLPVLSPLEGYTFQGYKNKDGSVGTKNVLAIATSVQCVAGFADHLASRVSQELLQKYPNVDGVVPINHGYGCGVALNSPLSKIPVRTSQHILQNPNFGNQVMILGLGCEKLRPEQLLNEVKNMGDHGIMYMQDPELHGFQAMVNQAMRLADQHLRQLNERKRESCDASELVVGLQCGGSDGFSGLTGNPVAGFAADLIVRAGGSVMFSEVTEVRDAIHLLAPRAVNESVRQSLIDEMRWYDKYLSQGQADRSANPTPGNHQGGLSNVVEKAMCSVVKSGTSPIVDVIPAGERCSKHGLSFAATPASDFVCGTLQVAAGMNMHVFVTGRGSPYGLSMVPVVKVSTNSELAKRWHDLIDIDAGVVATGERTIEEMGWALFEYILQVASGNEVVASDRLGLHNDLVLFNPGPVT
jgi:galactarate dehydratase